MDIESKEHRAGHPKGNNFKHLSTYVPSSSSCRHSKVISNWNGLRKHVGLSNTTFKNQSAIEERKEEVGFVRGSGTRPIRGDVPEKKELSSRTMLTTFTSAIFTPIHYEMNEAGRIPEAGATVKPLRKRGRQRLPEYEGRNNLAQICSGNENESLHISNSARQPFRGQRWETQARQFEAIDQRVGLYRS
jgi:hypothetical protein